MVLSQIWSTFRSGFGPDVKTEVQKVVNPVILDDKIYIQNQGFAENISKK